ncbi:MAG: NAD(P)-dependent oxidoreductase [Acidimicrobiia bacterium]|nr:NAD(P)-dependent oxidoreductase [Acidimicrobiia bacterium]
MTDSETVGAELHEIIGFIGLGTMGGPIASNIQSAGRPLVVHDLDRSAAARLLAGGAEWADAPREVAERCDVVLTSLPGPAEVERVALGSAGLAEGAHDGLAYFDLSTNAPSMIRRIADVLSPVGVDVFDAPVSGGPDGAASGRLAVWVGGDETALERWRAMLSVFSDEVHHIGPIGAGAVAKLVHNCSGYVIQTALAETFSLGVKAGVEPDRLWEAVRHGALGRRRTFDSLARNYLPGRFEPADFALRLARKDVALACELGHELGVPMRLANLTLQELTEADGRGWGDRDSRAAMLLQEERADVECRVPADRLTEIQSRE